MNRVRFSAQAEHDLDQVFGYIAADSPNTANSFVERVRQSCRRFARLPNSGRPREDLEPGLRSFAVGSFLVLYRAMPNGIEIARIVSGQRDLPSLFEDE